MLLFSLALSVLATAGYLLAASPGSLLFFRCIEGVSRGVFWPSIYAIIADNTAYEGRGTASSRFTTFYAVGEASGNVFGGLLMQYVGIRSVLPFYPVVSMLAFFVVLFGISPVQEVGSQVNAKSTKSGWQEFRTIWPVCSVSFAYGGFLFSIWGLLSLVAAHFNVSFVGIGVVFTFFWLARLVGIWVAGNQSKKFGRKHTLIFGLSLCALSTGILINAKQFIILSLATALGGFGSGVILPMTITVLADLATPENRGLAMGISEFSLGIGSIVQTSVAGILGEMAGVSLTYSFSLAIFLTTVVVIWNFLNVPKELGSPFAKQSRSE